MIININLAINLFICSFYNCCCCRKCVSTVKPSEENNKWKRPSFLLHWTRQKHMIRSQRRSYKNKMWKVSNGFFERIRRRTKSYSCNCYYRLRRYCKTPILIINIKLAINLFICTSSPPLVLSPPKIINLIERSPKINQLITVITLF